jgi:hypothetical protein
MSLHDKMRKRLLDEAGVFDRTWGHSREVGMLEMRATEWSKVFEEHMRTRLIMGRFRYGAMKDPAKGKFDNIGSAIARLQKYQKQGNQELLVDVANLCMIEFTHPNHNNPRFWSEDDGEHAEPLK